MLVKRPEALVQYRPKRGDLCDLGVQGDSRINSAGWTVVEYLLEFPSEWFIFEQWMAQVARMEASMEAFQSFYA